MSHTSLEQFLSRRFGFDPGTLGPKAVEEVAPAAPAPGEPMDLNTAIQVGWFGVVGAWMLVDGWVDEGG